VSLLVLFLIVAFLYAALQDAKSVINKFTSSEKVGAFVFVLISLGALSRVVTAAKLDEWSFAKAYKSLLLVVMKVLAEFSKMLAGIVVKFANEHDRIHEEVKKR
jgi:hypothetical protein